MTTQTAPRLRTVGINVTGAEDTVVYTCPANFTSKVTLVFISNHASGTTQVSLKWQDVSNGDSPYNILKSYTINNNNFLQLSDAYLVLNSGDQLIVSATSSANVDVIVSCEEYYDPAQTRP